MVGCLPSTRARSWSASTTTPGEAESARTTGPSTPPGDSPTPAVVLARCSAPPTKSEGYLPPSVNRVTVNITPPPPTSSPFTTTSPIPIHSHDPHPHRHHATDHHPVSPNRPTHDRHLPPLRGGNRRRRHDVPTSKSRAVWPEQCRQRQRRLSESPRPPRSPARLRSRPGVLTVGGIGGVRSECGVRSSTSPIFPCPVNPGTVGRGRAPPAPA